MDEATLFLFVSPTGRKHIVNPDEPTRTFCDWPLAGNGKYGDRHRMPLKEDKTGYAEPRNVRPATLADERARNRIGPPLFFVCKTCMKEAGVTP